MTRKFSNTRLLRQCQNMKCSVYFDYNIFPCRSKIKKLSDNTEIQNLKCKCHMSSHVHISVCTMHKRHIFVNVALSYSLVQPKLGIKF